MEHGLNMEYQLPAAVILAAMYVCICTVGVCMPYMVTTIRMQMGARSPLVNAASLQL